MTPTGMIDVRGDMGGAQQRVHVLRQKWEESWLAEQRSVTAVIDQSGERPLAADDAKARQLTHSNDDLSRDTAAAQPTQREIASSVASSGPTTASVQAASAFARAPEKSATPAVAIVHTRAEAQPSARDPEVKIASTPQEPRSHLRTSVFWHREGAIEGAMRLRDPEQSGQRILAHLRQWLRDSGTYLRKVLVNGRLAWQSDAPSSSTAGRETPASPNRHTYI